MPKYGVHHIVMKDAAQKLQTSNHRAATHAADVINSNMSSALIGSIGPDLLFWAPDYDAVEFLYTLYKNIEDVVDLVNAIVEPISDVIDAVGKPVDLLVDTLAPRTVQLIEHLLNEVRETFSLFASAVGTGLFKGVLSGVDWLTDAAGMTPAIQGFFQSFVPDLQHNANEEDWYWFDMLHYRQTGAFARSLVENAASTQQKAFAFGYMSHIATDVSGHPYINQIVGAPYRLNVQRHVTAENYQDTWKYAQYYNGESINQTLFDQLGFPETLPTMIGDLLHNAFKETYDSVDHPRRLPGDGFYTRGQIDDTYEAFYGVLKLLKKLKVNRPEEPFSGVADILADALESFRPPPSPPSGGSSSCGWKDILSFGLTSSSRDCYDKFFREVATWVDYIGHLLGWTLEMTRNLIDLLLSVLLSLPIKVLLAILYGIQLLCYQTYRTMRSFLSQCGFISPEPDELDTSIGRNLVTLFQPCASNFKTFPSVNTPVNSHLVCPVYTPEEPITAVSFYQDGINSTPDLFIKDDPFRIDYLYGYASSSTPEQTRSHEDGGGGIGNAVDFTVWMIRKANDPNTTEGDKSVVYTNWNLDADRGYGYLTWKGVVPQGVPWVVNNEEYL